MKKVLGFVLAFAVGLDAQYPTYPGCPPLKDSDFREVELFNLQDDPSMNEPMRMDFHQDAQGNVNIYFVERAGKIKYYDALTKTVNLVGTLDVLFATESGLLGIALDPAFRSNRFVYFYWSPKNVKVYRLSRFTLKSDNTLDLASEKVVLDIPDTRIGINVHNGGGLQFDRKGDLWITVGEHDHISHEPTHYHNTTDREVSGEDESPDTYSLYGSVLRIHPLPDGSYTIPKDNFGEFWSRKFAAEGRGVLSSKYKDTALVRPEIYVKGFRDVMSVQVDPQSGWAVISECGAQCHKIPVAYYCPAHGKSEKIVLATEPGYHGWPYFHADNHPYVMNKAQEKNPLKPVNNSPFRRGVDTLPPAIPGTYLYGLPKTIIANNWICNVGGFMYRYDGSLASPVKFPPHFDGRFFMKDLNQSFIRAVEVDPKGAFVKASEDLFTTVFTKSHSIDVRQGPDGAMYLLNYSKFQYTRDNTTGIFRIEYTGNCKPSTVAVEAVRNGGPAIELTGNLVRVTGMGRHSLALHDVSGVRLRTWKGVGPAAYPMDLPQGIFFLRTETGGLVRKIVLGGLSESARQHQEPPR